MIPTKMEWLANLADQTKPKSYSQKEIYYHLEVLPLNRKSAIKSTNKK